MKLLGQMCLVLGKCHMPLCGIINSGALRTSGRKSCGKETGQSFCTYIGTTYFPWTPFPALPSASLPSCLPLSLLPSPSFPPTSFPSLFFLSSSSYSQLISPLYKLASQGLWLQASLVVPVMPHSLALAASCFSLQFAFSYFYMHYLPEDAPSDPSWKTEM